LGLKVIGLQSQDPESRSAEPFDQVEQENEKHFFGFGTIA
jgi:hypothetical protein